MRWTLTNTTTGTVVDSRYSWDGDKQLNSLTASNTPSTSPAPKTPKVPTPSN